MKGSFEKIKKSAFYAAIVKSVVVGCSIGLIAVGAVLLPLKLNAVNINPVYYVLIGVGTALLCGGLTFLIVRPTEKKLAKLLDRKYVHGERVQTMVEYRDREGEILSLQREDAEQKIDEIVIKHAKKKNIFSRFFGFGAMLTSGGNIVSHALSILLVPVIAVSVFIPAIVVSGKEPVPVDGDKDLPYEFTSAQADMLRQLINDVDQSSLEPVRVKTPIKEDLQELLEILPDAKTEVAMYSSVIGAVASVDAIMYEVNTYRVVAPKIYEAEHLEALAAATESVVAYRVGGVSISKYEQVVALLENLDASVSERVQRQTVTVRETLNIPRGEGLDALLGTYYTELNGVLPDNSAESDDALISCIYEFTQDILKIASLDAAYADEYVQQQLNICFNKFTQSFVAALGTQSYNCMMNEYVRTRLADIFGVAIPAWNDGLTHGGSNGSEDDGEGDGDDDKVRPGGFGKGEMVYPSDEMLYDPDKREHVNYGELLEEYYSRVLEQIRDNEFSEELEQSIREYFEILLIGSKQDKENQ